MADTAGSSKAAGNGSNGGADEPAFSNEQFLGISCRSRYGRYNGYTANFRLFAGLRFWP